MSGAHPVVPQRPAGYTLGGELAICGAQMGICLERVDETACRMGAHPWK